MPFFFINKIECGKRESLESLWTHCRAKIPEFMEKEKRPLKLKRKWTRRTRQKQFNIYFLQYSFFFVVMHCQWHRFIAAYVTQFPFCYEQYFFLIIYMVRAFVFVCRVKSNKPNQNKITVRLNYTVFSYVGSSKAIDFPTHHYSIIWCVRQMFNDDNA